MQRKGVCFTDLSCKTLICATSSSLKLFSRATSAIKSLPPPPPTPRPGEDSTDSRMSPGKGLLSAAVPAAAFPPLLGVAPTLPYCKSKPIWRTSCIWRERRSNSLSLARLSAL